MNGISKCSSSEYSEDDPFGRMLSFVTAGVEEGDPKACLVTGIQSQPCKRLPFVVGAAFRTSIC